MVNKHVVIIGLTRSGTSMVAGLFAHHGVFSGTCKEADSRNAKGFFEHVGFTNIVLELYGRGKVSRGEPLNPHPGFRRRMLTSLEEDGYEKGPWMIKHAPVYYKTWYDFEPSFVLVRRDTASISGSAEELGWKSGRAHIAEGQRLLNNLAEELKAPQVMSNELIEGNYASIRLAFEHCGLDFDEKIATEFIEPGLWKHSVKSLEEDTSVIMRDKNYVKPNHKKGQKHA